MSDDSKLEQLFQTYRGACPDVEPSANFMPNLWRKIESRHSFGFVFKNAARMTMTACAALCLLLVFLNFAAASRDRVEQAPNYADVLALEHTAENTDFTEAIQEAPVPHDR